MERRSLQQLNRFKEKAIGSNFPLDTTKDMLGMASNWDERLRPHKCDKKISRFGLHLSPPANSNR